MTLSIKQKLSSLIIGSIFLTGLAITLAYYYITLYQTNQENNQKMTIAERGIDQRLNSFSQTLNKEYFSFQADKKLNANVYNIIHGRLVKFQMFPGIMDLDDRMGIDGFAFYYAKVAKSRPILHLYSSKKLDGSVIVSDGQHKFYRKRQLVSTAINNPAFYPSQIPDNRIDGLVIKNGQIIYQSWRDYFHLNQPAKPATQAKLGTFLLEKKLAVDLKKLSVEMGVDFTLYDRSGRVIFSQNEAADLILPLPNKRQRIRLIDRNQNSSDSVLKPLRFIDHTVGFISVSIATELVEQKIKSGILLMSLVSASIVLVLLLLVSHLVARLTAPISQLTRASKAIAKGDLKYDIDVARNDELGALASNFISMRDAIGQQVEKLKGEINERKEAQKSVLILSQAVEQSPVAVVITDAKGYIEYVNSSFETNSGYGLSESVGKRPENLGSGINLGRRRDQLQQTLLAGEIWEEEFESRKKNGTIYWEHVHVAPVTDTSGNISHYLSVREDITLRKLQEERIYHQAHFDSLTDLPNRFLALDRLNQQIDDAERSGKMVAVIFLDLDGFKKINDTLGHEVGDRLLIQAASRLKSVIRKPDTVARLGGDEFVILLSGLSAVSNVSRIAEKILESIKQVFIIHKRQLNLTASAGIAVYPSDGNDVTELLKNADSAMYHSKGLGRNTYSFFTKEMNANIARELAIEEQLHGALQREELSVLYQPQIDIVSGKIIGAEALVRWNNKALGMVSPVEFISVAEQAGIIVQIGDFVLQQALEMTLRWRVKTSSEFRIAVNLSPRQFHEPRMVENIANKLSALDLPTEVLELEITEGVLLSGHTIIDESLKKLSELGFCIAMDDFGTGYSSLSYLRKYPFKVLKIDRSFVKDVISSAADRELVSATIAMAHGLGLKVVAEGVETAQQFEYLAEKNCDIAQGYLFGKPMSEQELFSLAKRQHLSVVS